MLPGMKISNCFMQSALNRISRLKAGYFLRLASCKLHEIFISVLYIADKAQAFSNKQFNFMDRRNITITVSRRTLKIAGVILFSVILIFSTLTYAYGQIGQVNVIATVSGWFKAEQVDNETVSLATNMNVWVNGRQFVVCKDPDQPVNTVLMPNF